MKLKKEICVFNKQSFLRQMASSIARNCSRLHCGWATDSLFQRKMDQLEEETWYICRDVVDSIVCNIVLPTDNQINNQRTSQIGEENTSIDSLLFWKIVKHGEHLLRGEGLGKANSFLETSVTQVANQSHTLPACLSPMKSTSKTQTPQPYLTDSSPVDWTPQRVNPHSSMFVPQLFLCSSVVVK